MNKLWVTAATAILLSACGSQIVEQSKFDIAQRRQIEQENAEKEARVREEQQELERQRERQRQRDEAAKRAAQIEVPAVRPLETGSLHEKVLASPGGTFQHQEVLPAGRAIYYDYDAY